MNFIKNNTINFGSRVINNYLTGNLQGINAVSEDFNNWNIIDENGQRVLTFDSFIKSSVNSENQAGDFAASLSQNTNDYNSYSNNSQTAQF